MRTPSPSTMAEKVLARASGRDSVVAGDLVTAEVDLVMAHETFALCAMQLMNCGVRELAHPERVCVILDHYYPAPNERMAQAHAVTRRMAEELGVGHYLGHAGIGHQVLVERGLVMPGMLVLAVDSHSTTYGAVGAAGAGIGVTEMSYLLATGKLWFQVPPTLRFILSGTLAPGVMSKDIILWIAGRYGTDVAQYKAIELTGEVASELSIASRMTMANMGVELGAKFALFEADDTAMHYLRARTDQHVEPFGPDPGATYEAVHDVDVTDIEPQVACPHSPGNVKPISEVGDVPVQQAFLGSCTNARVEDLAVAAAILEGRTVHPRTRLVITPASHSVYLEATRAGHTEILLAAGGHITPAGCGACPGGHGGVLGGGDVCISSTNRNFRGRMGSPDAEVYLGSPATVAASAIAGRIADPRELQA